LRDYLGANSGMRDCTASVYSVESSADVSYGFFSVMRESDVFDATGWLK
jgi:hypothetical protein